MGPTFYQKNLDAIAQKKFSKIIQNFQKYFFAQIVNYSDGYMATIYILQSTYIDRFIKSDNMQWLMKFNVQQFLPEKKEKSPRSKFLAFFVCFLFAGNPNSKNYRHTGLKIAQRNNC